MRHKRFTLICSNFSSRYQPERIFAVASCPSPQGLPPSNQTSTPETPLVPNESASFLAPSSRSEEEPRLCALFSHSFQGFSDELKRSSRGARPPIPCCRLSERPRATSLRAVSYVLTQNRESSLERHRFPEKRLLLSRTI